jgi:transposase
VEQNERKKYSREFKLEALRQTQIMGKSVAEVARELEIPVHQLYKWRSDADRKQAEVFPGSGHATPNTELEALRRDNKRLREERDILKKSLGFFARDASLGTDLSGNTGENSK